MPTAISIVTVFVLLASSLFSIYQVYLSPVVKSWGVFLRADGEVEGFNIGSRDCWSVAGLEGCEKISLHEPTGYMYLACSARRNRLSWLEKSHLPPTKEAFINYHSSSESSLDYIAIYDTVNNKTIHPKFTGGDGEGNGKDWNTYLKGTAGIHGMDIVSASSLSSSASKGMEKIRIYLINHRYPSNGGHPKDVGFDSVIEVLETVAGTEEIRWITTLEDPEAIINPNDIVAVRGEEGEGDGVWFTNFFGQRSDPGVFKLISALFFRPTSSIGYCHIPSPSTSNPYPKGYKCTLAHTHSKDLQFLNGITTNGNGTFYVSSTFSGRITVLDLVDAKSNDGKLEIRKVIETESGMDNMSIDQNENVWVVAFPKILNLLQFMKDPTSILSPVSIFRLSAGAEKESHVVDTVWRDDGKFLSGVTVAVHDNEKKRLYLHGLLVDNLIVCRL